MSRLFIELLSVEKGKAYGYQEYAFNLLNYFYNNRNDIHCEVIVIWCKKTELDLFHQFEDRFTIQGYDYSSYLKRLWLQTILPFKNGLTFNDLLFSPGNTSGLIKRSKEILTIHDLLFKRKNWLPNTLIRFQREVMIPVSIKKADRIVTISQFTKNDVEHYYPSSKGKINVIYNSFNFTKYEGGDVVDYRDDYFIAISNNANYKNQKVILSAYHNYIEKGGEKSLVIIGRMSPTSEAALVYNSLPQSIKDKVVWKSNISNLELGALYKGASCFISASKFEGLGMPVVEAMSFGLPVLLSDIPPHREVSMNKGVYFEASDVEALTNKMLNMNFERRDYGKDVKDMFSEHNTSAEYVELFNQLLQTKE